MGESGMKIINKKEFLELPAYTLYQKYRPQIFDEIEIKVSGPNDVWGRDFLVLSLSGFAEGNICSSTNSDIIDTGNFRWDLKSIGRDGLFEDDQLFCVYDKEDVARLISQLNKCL